MCCCNDNQLHLGGTMCNGKQRAVGQTRVELSWYRQWKNAILIHCIGSFQFNFNLRRHCPNLSNSGTIQKQTGWCVLLPTAFRQPRTADLGRAKVATNAIGLFIAADM